MSEPRQTAIHHQAVRQQLEKILAHGLFTRSERMGRFLRLAVERSIKGKAGELKEYLLGVEVFDRKPTYDPRVDPIVRVEARRLRSKLKQYYESDGRADPIVIEFVKGSYAPQIHVKGETPPAPSAVVTTAVLPFVNLSPHPDDEYFSDGLTEELIHALTKVPGMRVVAWNTAAQLRDRQQDILAIRQQLKVGAVLTGSVRIAGPSLRVRAQLIDTETGVYLWSETFDRQMQDVFAIQEEIARAIVRTLRGQMAGKQESAIAPRGRTTISSYDWYLKGRYLWHRRTPEDMAQSVKCFENAVAADGNSALAQAGLADAFSLLSDHGMMHPAEAVPRAKAAAERAIALDPDLAEPYASLAFIRGLYEWEWEDAERLFKRAIALNPGYATAHHWLGCDHYAMLGRFDEALDEITIAIQLDPLSSIIQENRGYILMLRREYEAAIAAYRELQAFDPTFYKGYTSMGRAYAQIGRYAEALAMLEKGRSLAGDLPSILGAMGQVSALSGDERRARELLAELERLAQTRYVASTSYALVWLGLGEKAKALDWLEKGCGLRESPLTTLKVHPVYDPLRGEPRFQELLRRLRLA
ncbi:Tetratricopeptide TPR_4 [Candidatus Sulfopaludibacter sp. SbA4]|nr:Tetratricopeptide TPR_4 [Candidatus Sulfopaludibacter sp. SbA4]